MLSSIKTKTKYDLLRKRETIPFSYFIQSSLETRVEVCYSTRNVMVTAPLNIYKRLSRENH